MQVSPGQYIFDILDWLHVVWRLRRIYLDPSKTLAFGGLAISHAALSANLEVFGLCGADVDPSNKQSYSGDDYNVVTEHDHSRYICDAIAMLSQ